MRRESGEQEKRLDDNEMRGEKRNKDGGEGMRWVKKRGIQRRREENRELGMALVAVLTFSLSITPLPSCLRFSLTNSPVIYEQEPSWRWGSTACVHMHFCKHTHDSSAQTHTDVLLKTLSETQTHMNNTLHQICISCVCKMALFTVGSSNYLLLFFWWRTKDKI